MEHWQSLITALGGGVIIGAILVKVVAKWISDRVATAVDARVKHTYDRQIEDLRSELNARQGILAAGLSAAHAGHMASQERRIAAVERLWQTVLGFRELASGVVFVYDILVPEEYDLPFKNPNIGAGIPRDEMEFHKRFSNVPSIEESRPFLGPELWALFWIYRAFCARLSFKAIEGRKHGRIPEWDKNHDGKRDYVADLLERVLSADEMQIVRAKTLMAPRTAVDLLEQHILAAADRWLSGASVADLSLAEGKRLAEALRFVIDVTGKAQMKRPASP